MRSCVPFAGGEARTPSAVAKGTAAAHHLQLLKLLQRCAEQAEEQRLPLFLAYSRIALVEFAMLHSEQPARASPVRVTSVAVSTAVTAGAASTDSAADASPTRKGVASAPKGSSPSVKVCR